MSGLSGTVGDGGEAVARPAKRDSVVEQGVADGGQTTSIVAAQPELVVGGRATTFDQDHPSVGAPNPPGSLILFY